MAKINTYPTATPALNDKIVGTDVSNATTDPNGKAVNFLLSDLKTLGLTDTGQFLSDSGVFLADSGAFLADSGAFLSDNVITTLGRALVDDTGQTTMQTTLGLGSAAIQDTGYFLSDTGTHLSDSGAFLSDGVITTLGRALLDDTGQTTMHSTLGLVVGTDVQAFDADTLKADTADVLTAGFGTTAYNAGTKSSGTYTPDEANGNMQYAVNGGAHTLAPPTNNCTIIVHYTNNASAGAITTTGFTLVEGAADLTTTNTDEFLAYIAKVNDVSHVVFKALQ